MSLTDSSGVVHIGIFAPRDQRDRRLAKRLRIGIGEASKLVRRFDNDRQAWFSKLANTEPEDRSLYDIVLDVDHHRMSDSEISNQIVRESIQVKYGDEAHPAAAY